MLSFARLQFEIWARGSKTVVCNVFASRIELVELKEGERSRVLK